MNHRISRINFFLLGFLLFYLIGAGLLAMTALRFFPSYSGLVLSATVYPLVFGGALLFFLRRTRQPAAGALRLHRVPAFSVLLSVLIGLLIQPTLMMVSYASQCIFKNFVSSSVAELLTLPLPLVLLTSALLPALFEEFLCRGLILHEYRSCRPAVGLIVSALFFALLHGNLQQALYALTAGILFGLMATWTGSVWPSFTAHFTVNASQLILARYWPAADTVDSSPRTLLLYGLLVLGTLPAVILCLRRLRRRHAVSGGTEGWPAFSVMWPFYLFLAFAGILCVLSEFMPA